jgi:hypothetical protein
MDLLVDAPLCLICLEEKPTVGLLCCGAQSHLCCLGKWIKHGGSTCPQCRYNFIDNSEPVFSGDHIANRQAEESLIAALSFQQPNFTDDMGFITSTLSSFSQFVLGESDQPGRGYGGRRRPRGRVAPVAEYGARVTHPDSIPAADAMRALQMHQGHVVPVLRTPPSSRPASLHRPIAARALPLASVRSPIIDSEVSHNDSTFLPISPDSYLNSSTQEQIPFLCPDRTLEANHAGSHTDSGANDEFYYSPTYNDGLYGHGDTDHGTVETTRASDYIRDVPVSVSHPTAAIPPVATSPSVRDAMVQDGYRSYWRYLCQDCIFVTGLFITIAAFLSVSTFVHDILYHSQEILDNFAALLEQLERYHDDRPGIHRSNNWSDL